VSTPWPARLCLREGAINAASGRWSSALVVVTVCWLMAAAGALDAIAVARLVAAERAWIDAGAFVLVVEAARSEQRESFVPAAACDRLARLDGIEASFAVSRAPQGVALTQAPGGTVSLLEVTAGASTFLDVPDDPRGVALVTQTLAARTGLSDGDPLALTRTARSAVTAGHGSLGTHVLRARVVDPAQLGEEFDGAVLVPNLTGDVDADRCYVRTDSPHAAATEALLMSALADEDRAPVVGPRLHGGEFTVSHRGAYSERPLRWAWAAAAAVLVLLWASAHWSRRSETAVYATFGVTRARRALMEWSEWTVLVAAGACWGWALGVVGACLAGAAPATALVHVSTQVGLTAAAASVGVVLLGLRPAGSLLDDLKDR